MFCVASEKWSERRAKKSMNSMFCERKWSCGFLEQEKKQIFFSVSLKLFRFSLRVLGKKKTKIIFSNFFSEKSQKKDARFFKEKLEQKNVFALIFISALEQYRSLKIKFLKSEILFLTFQKISFFPNKLKNSKKLKK